MNPPLLLDRFYPWVVKRRNPIVLIFKIFYLLQATLFFLGADQVITKGPYWGLAYDAARFCGELAIIFYILASIPGIARRFGIYNKLISILMIFRRYVGIATYLFVLMHAGIVRIVPWLIGMFPIFPMEIFIMFGVAAHMMLFLLFITSNDLSVNKLGIWWNRIHDLMYTIVWVIFLHVALQGPSIWSLLIGFAAVAQISSHIFSYYKKRVINVRR